MVATRSKRKQANEEFINLPYSKKKNKIPKKKEKQKKKKTRKPKKPAKKNPVELEIVDNLEETMTNDDDMDITKVAKNYKISNKPP